MGYITIKKIINIALATGLTLGIYCYNAKAEEGLKIHWGYNALENAATIDTSQEKNPMRNRLITNVNLNLEGFEVGFNGSNDINDLNRKTYLGSNRFLISRENSKTNLLVKTSENKEGVVDTKIGLRNTSLMERLKGYGYLEGSVDEESANISLFYGKPFGKGFSFEFFQSADFQQDKPIWYNEIQINKILTNSLTLFGRAEITDFDKDKATYLLGITVKLGGK